MGMQVVDEQIDADLVVRDFSALLGAVNDQAPFPSRLKRAALNEAWFSDMLAWLLNVQGNHGFGTAFAEQFLRKIAQARTADGQRYAHRKKFLRFGRSQTPGTPWSGFRLGNSAVFREFYLANSSHSFDGPGGAFCDVAFLDLDSKDGIFLAIENKLFTTNRAGQLESYFNLIESRYQRAKVLEYVYLTLTGESPAHACDQNWVCLSWVHDILDILDIPDIQPRTGNSDVQQLRQILAWLKAAFSPEDQTTFTQRLSLLFEGMVSAATECIVDELQRLNEGARGQWRVQRQGKNSTRIIHSSKPRTPLHVGIMPNLSIALYNRKKGAQGFDKVLIPFGSNPDQIFNLMDFAARDIYQLHFGENYRLYLGDRRRLTSTVVPARAHSRKLFHFVHKHRQEIQLLIPIARRLRRQDLLVPVLSN